jgi:hypothetical protein
VNRVEVARAAQAPGEIVDAAGLREGERQRAGQEVIGPVELSVVAAGHRAPQGVDEHVDDVVEILRHHLSAELR